MVWGGVCDHINPFGYHIKENMATEGMGGRYAERAYIGRTLLYVRLLSSTLANNAIFNGWELGAILISVWQYNSHNNTLHNYMSNIMWLPE